MRDISLTLILLSFVLCVAGCAEPPQVAQGTVVSYDSATQILVIRDDARPEATLTFSLAGAEIGADPVPGDSVRVAYREDRETPTATRVMNLTRQAEVAGKSVK